jgi:hypothetical protein
MSTPLLLSRFATAILSPPVSRYILHQRNRLGPGCSALTDTAKVTVRGYFGETDLDRVRVVVADPLPIADPPLAGFVRRVGFDFPSVKGGLKVSHCGGVKGDHPGGRVTKL